MPAVSSAVLRRSDREPLIAERVPSFELMMVVVSAGYALGLAGGSHIAASRESGVVARPLAGRSPMLTTYLLRREGDVSEVLTRFIERVQAIDLPEGKRHVLPLNQTPRRKSSYEANTRCCLLRGSLLAAHRRRPSKPTCRPWKNWPPILRG